MARVQKFSPVAQGWIITRHVKFTHFLLNNSKVYSNISGVFRILFWPAAGHSWVNPTVTERKRWLFECERFFQTLLCWYSGSRFDLFFCISPTTRCLLYLVTADKLECFPIGRILMAALFNCLELQCWLIDIVACREYRRRPPWASERWPIEIGVAGTRHMWRSKWFYHNDIRLLPLKIPYALLIGFVVLFISRISPDIPDRLIDLRASFMSKRLSISETKPPKWWNIMTHGLANFAFVWENSHLCFCTLTNNILGNTSTNFEFVVWSGRAFVLVGR